ncbi:MAG: hypothetical protein EHM24_32585, partial [Acidobacteria bacterium]
VTVAASKDTAVGAAGAVNVITSDVVAELAGATVTAGGNVAVTATTTPTIRSLSMGVSGSGETAVTVTALGNVIVSTVTAGISSGSTVAAGGNVTLSAQDIAPSPLPDWMLTATQKAAVEDALADSPIDLRSSILAINISVAGSGETAVGVGIMGNVVTNRTKAGISNSIVRAGVNAAGTTTNAAADVLLTSHSTAGILAMTLGLGASSGSTAVQATGFGNVIVTTVDAIIAAGATVWAGDQVTLTAGDDSSIRSAGLSIAASSTNAIGAIIGANVITSRIAAEIAGSTVKNGGALSLTALSDADVLALSGGVGGSGETAVLVSLSANVIAGTTAAVITDATGLGYSLTPAGGAAKAVDPTTQLNSAGDTIDLGTGHKLKTGDAVVYSSGGGADIGGLRDGTTYYVIVQDSAPGKVKLAATAKDAKAGKAIDLGAPASSSVRSDVQPGGSVALTATNTSSIDALAFGVSGSGTTAVGVALAANVIANSTETAVSGTTLSTPGALSLTSESSAIIRTLAIGVSASSTTAVQV